ncbi:MAG: SCO family protein [Vicinamibacterales bacterium]
MARLTVPLLVLTLAAACAAPPPPPPASRYPIRGQLLGVELDTGRVVLRHEAVEGYMDGMTMPFDVADRAEVLPRRPGDLVTATLVVEPTRSYLEHLTLTGTAPLPEGVGGRPVAEGVHVLAPGDAVPALALTSQFGQPVSLADWRGAAGVVTFIYTRCPLPDFCPLLDRRFAEIQAAAAGDPALAGKVRLLSVSFDPAFDTPDVLAAHATRVGARPGWTFATAPPPVVDRFAAEFGGNVIRETDGTITHNLRTPVNGPGGRVTAVHSGNDWTAGQVLDDLRRALAGPGA